VEKPAEVKLGMEDVVVKEKLVDRDTLKVSKQPTNSKEHGLTTGNVNVNILLLFSLSYSFCSQKMATNWIDQVC
jgi:hypothetical protein